MHRSRWIPAALLLIATGLAITFALAKDDPTALPIFRPAAFGETQPVPHGGDSADDPAIWLHPTDPAKSLILGTDKQGGLIAYDLSGKAVQTVGEKSRPNNVDVIYDVEFATGLRADLAVGSTRSPAERGVKIWSIDAETGRLTDVTPGHALPVLGGGEPYGICTYYSTRSGKPYLFVTHKDGRVEQHQIKPAAGGVTLEKVRTLKLSSVVEGCVADDELGAVYIAEEGKGVWKFPAEPDGGTAGTLIIKAGEHGLKADVEGLTLYCAQDGKGYLIVSSQGNNTFKIYQRAAPHAFVATIDPKPGPAIGDVEDTDGIAAINVPMGPNYPQGLFVVQDGSNGKFNQNFKIFRWEDIAGKDLITDTTWNPRKPVRRD